MWTSFKYNNVIDAENTVLVDSLSFEESNIEDGRIKVDKLENIHLCCKIVIELRLGAM